MTPLDQLFREHRIIERMLDVLESAAIRIRDAQHVPLELLTGILDFFETFGHQCHHAKEEAVLFPALSAHVPDWQGVALPAFQAQHEAGCAYLREMRALLARLTGDDRHAADAFAASAMDYVHMEREHIRIEDHYFWRVARDLSSPIDDKALAERFAAIERTSLGPDPERYERLIPAYRALVSLAGC